MADDNLSEEVPENIQTNLFSKTYSAMVNKTFDKIMKAAGIIALVWIWAVLLVAMLNR